MSTYDVVIVGAGVVGASVARELSRRKGKFLLVDGASDVCEGTSKANSAIVHAGFDAVPGTKKALLNVQGSKGMPALCKELDVPLRRCGAMVICFEESQLPELRELYDRGLENGVEGLRLLSGEEARELEPHLTSAVCGALLAPTSAIVCPFTLTIAQVENAVENGVELRLNTRVTGLEKQESHWLLHTEQGEITARAVVNAAGVHSGELHNLACEDKLTIIPRAGEYCLLDKSAGNHVDHTIFQLPGAYGKGVLVSPTVHGNLLLGPTATDIADGEFTSTTRQGLAQVLEKSALSVEDIPTRQVITSFSGVRAHEAGDDFVLGESAPGFFDAAGIESPGLSSAPAIGTYLAGLLEEALGLQENTGFSGVRKGPVHMKELSPEERAEIIRRDPAFGNIICRCEEISEGEILQAIHRPAGATTLDGVKRRVRAGMGRCQGGFCSPRVMDILARELKLSLNEIQKSQPDSKIVLERTRGGIEE